MGFVKHGAGDWASADVAINDVGTAVLVALKTRGALYSRLNTGGWGTWTSHGRATWAPAASPAVAFGPVPHLLATKQAGDLYTRTLAS